MTVETKSYTDSAISDSIKQFFNRYKVEKSYKYIEMIDSRILQSQIIEIDFLDFTDEVKEMLEVQSKDRIHSAIYRAIGEVFQVRHGNAELENVKQEDVLKFRISNFNIFDDKVCGNPKLIHYEDYKKEDYENEDKINKVAKRLQQNNTFVTLRKTEEILLYNGKIYDRLQAESIIKEETEKLIPNCTTHNRNEVVNKIKAQTYTDLENFDTDPNLITVENGILNLETMELKPHTPEHLSRVLLPVEYHKPKHKDIEKNLSKTMFWKYLKTSFTVDEKFRKEDFETVIEIIASIIIKRHVDEKAFMFLGQGENGKSVCLRYIESIIGKKNISNISLQDITDDKFMRADLDGKSANIFPDLEQNELRHTGKIKAITSNEPIEVQRKHQQPFVLEPFCKLLFSCNRFPKVFDQSQGFFRRWLIIKWDRNFENDPERIEYLKEKLSANTDELNLVFSSLVSIANKLNRNGKFTYSKDWKTIQREWNENADPIDDFATNYIIDSETHKTKRETYQFYKKTILDKGEIHLGMGQFSKAFSEYHDEDRIKEDGRTERVWLNIDFKEPIQTTMKEIDDKR